MQKKQRKNGIVEFIQREEKKGITLIALVITIIVLLILAGVTISSLSGDNGILTNASRAKYATELSQYNEELQNFKANKLLENTSFEEESLMSSENSLDYNTKPEGEIGNIYNVITNLQGSNFAGKLEVIKGELLLNSQDKTEIEIAQSVGIAVNPYEIIDGELISSNGNLLLMDSTGTLRLPETITSIGEKAFANVEGLKTIIIPGTVKEIKKGAFQDNKDLEVVILEEGVQKINEEAFARCRKLKQINLPESLITIGNGALQQCTSLTSITIPSKITKIYTNTFFQCYNLTNVNLPDNLTELQSNCFYGCNLNSIEINKNVNTIGSNVFYSCNNLENINIDPENKNYIYENGILMTNDKSSILFISNKILSTLTTFEIPDGVVNFNISLLKYTKLENLIIPASLKQIEPSFIPTSIKNIQVDSNNKFMIVENDCLYNIDKTSLILCFSKQENVELSNNLTTLKSYCFSAAPNITNIDLPESVTTINSQVFSSLKNLFTLYIGKNVKSIAPLFIYTNYQIKVTINNQNPYYTIEDDVLYTKDKSTLITILKEIQGKYTVSNSVKKIGSNAFHNQNKMTEIELPDGLLEIGNSFNYCSSLLEIHIPKTVEKIGNDCFRYDNSLDLIVVDKSYGEIDGSPWGAIKGNRIVQWK